jgi:hypothetical protein
MAAQQVKLLGSAGATPAEVETNTNAMRVVIRPDDYATLGIYALGAISGTMAAGLAGGSPIFSFRYGGANTVLLKKMIISMGDLAGFTAGSAELQGFVALSFTASDTGGTSVTPTTSSNRLRTSMATTGVTDIRISSTGTLTAGTRVLSSEKFIDVEYGNLATAGAIVLAPVTLFESLLGDYPLVFGTNEGFVLQIAQVQATGTWSFAVNLVWEEVTFYGQGLAA